MLKGALTRLWRPRPAMSTPLRYLFAFAVFLLALLVRELLFSVGAGHPYVTFFPAVVVALYFFGIGPGTLVAVLSAATGYYISSLPYLPSAPRHESLLGAATFLVAAFLIGTLVNELQDTLAKLSAATIRLNRSEQLYRGLLEDQTDIICRIKADGTIIYVNDAFCRLFGKSKEELIGKPWHPETWHEDVPLVEEKLKTLSPANPVVSIESRVITKDQGIVWRQFLNRGFFGEDGSLLEIQSVGRDIDERKCAERRIGFLATHDPLTELPNRSLFYDRLSQAFSRARRKAEHLALLLLDLDDFKPINDRYGHEAGDETLKIVAQRLLGCMRSMDTVARLGGDEFGIILGEIENRADIKKFAEKIIAALSAPLGLHAAAEVRVGISIGIAIYPQCGREIDKLMNGADQAMYESKARGKNRYTFAPGRAGGKAPDLPAVTLDGAHVVGLPLIDMQHQVITEMLNNFNAAVQHSDPEPVIVKLFDDLVQFVGLHFETEQRLMDECRYADQDAHKASHQHLLDDVSHLRERLADGGEMLALQALKDWFLPHIVNFDKPLAEFLMHSAAGADRVS